jgi:hypothetical protein
MFVMVITRNESEYSRIVEYIENNPANWEKDCFSQGENRMKKTRFIERPPTVL